MKKKIILEVDGSIHNLKEIYELDLYKQILLKQIGYKVIRIKNEEILLDIYSTLDKIKTFIK